MLLNANTVPCNQGPFQLESASWYQDWIPEAALSVSLMPSSKALQKLYSQHHSERIQNVFILPFVCKENEKVNSVNSSVNSFQRFFTCAACLRHFLQISSSLAERLEQLLKHLSGCESDTNGFLEDLDRPCQLPWPRFSKHLARRRGLLRPGS